MPSDWVKIALSFVSGLAVALISQWAARRSGQKALSYEFSSVEIGRLNGPFKDRLEIFFQAKKVDDVSAVTITIKKVGSTHISASDFEDDLRVCFPGSATILDLRFSVPKESGLRPSISSRNADEEPTAFFIAPLLLNAGDEFSLFALVNGFKNEVSLTGRLMGIGKIAAKSNQPDGSLTLGELARTTSPFMLMVVAAKFILLPKYGALLSPPIIVTIYIGIWIVVSFAYGFYWSRKT